MIFVPSGLTQDTLLPIRSSPFYLGCLDGTLDGSPENLYAPFSMPYVILARLLPIAEELRKISDCITNVRKPQRSSVEPSLMSLKSLGENAIDLGMVVSQFQSEVVLYKHKVIQFMRCYAVVAKFCPKIYLSSVFEWLIAQCVEMSALFAMMLNLDEMWELVPQIKPVVNWVQGNVAFVLCFVRGTHLQSLLSSDYDQGLKSLQGEETTVDFTGDAVCDTLEALRDQVLRMEQQEESYIRLAKQGMEANESSIHFYKSIPEMVLQTNWDTVHALCISAKRVPELETVVAPLFRLYTSVGREMDLVHWAIDKDIGEGVKEANLLFRTPSTGTRLLRTVFFCPEGSDYLKSIVLPPLKKLLKRKEGVELDPNRLPFDMDQQMKDEYLKSSAKMIISTADAIMQNAFKSVELVPTQIRKFLLYSRNTFMGAQSHMKETAATKLVVASLFFLRFICPAVVTPHAFGVMEFPPNMDFQRGLILVGKVLQNTASGVEFDGSKELYMNVCNSFVTSNQASMLKLFNGLIDAQSIGVRELKVKKEHQKTMKARTKKEYAKVLAEEFEEKVYYLRDCALIVNEFGMKRSFLNVYRQTSDEEAVRTARSLIKLDVKLHEQRVQNRAEHIMSKVLKVSTPYSSHLQDTITEFAEYLPNDLIVFSQDEIAVNYETSDTANVGPLTHPLLLLDAITAHRPSRLAAIARMLRSSCQEVWEAGIALRDLSQGSAKSALFEEIWDQETPETVEEGDDGEDDDSDSAGVVLITKSGIAGTPTSPVKVPESSSRLDKKGSVIQKITHRMRSNSEASDSPPNLSSEDKKTPSSPMKYNSAGTPECKSSNQLSGLLEPVKRSKSSVVVKGMSPFHSPFSTPNRKRKALKKKGVGGLGSDQKNLWAPALVFPQVLGLLHFLTVLRHTLKHARLENRVILETPDADSVLANCIFEYSKIVKHAGSQLLALAIADPTSPEIGNLGLSIANAGVLLTRSALSLMNVDRQILKHHERKSKTPKETNSSEGSKTTDASPTDTYSSASSSTSKKHGKRKKLLQKTQKTNFNNNNNSSKNSPRMRKASRDEISTSTYDEDDSDVDL